MASATALALTLSATHRVIDRIHCHTTGLRTDTKPSGSTRLAADDIDVFDISNLADGSIALLIDTAKFSRCQFDKGISPLAVAQNSLRSSTADNLTATTGNQLYIVKRQTEWDCF